MPQSSDIVPGGAGFGGCPVQIRTVTFSPSMSSGAIRAFSRVVLPLGSSESSERLMSQS